VIGNSRTGPRTGLGVLFLAGTALLFFGTSRVNLAAAQTVSPVASPEVAPTPDRLLEPTLPAAPGAADLGAQVYWLYCMPCHGDRGQGLTDEFRQVYPPEDRYCWNSGCHGERPYENGFTLPAQVPAVIGGEVDQRFPTTAALDVFVRAAMPRQAPGSLDAKEYDQVIAFLSRENALDRMSSVQGTAPAGQVSPAIEPPAQVPTLPNSELWLVPSSIVALAAIGIGTVVGVLLFLRRRPRPPAS